MVQGSIELPIQSGVRKFQNYLGAKRKIYKAVKEALKVAVPTGTFEGVEKGKVALKTGRMRREIADNAERQLDQQIGKKKMVFELSPKTADQIAARNSKADYVPYHWRGHSKFKFPGGYVNPTTSGTRPVNAANIVLHIRNKIIEEVNEKLQAAGLEVKATGGFSK